MTQQHVFYIPIVFLLGFSTGYMFMYARINKIEHTDTPHKAIARKRLLLTLIIFALVFMITHVLDLPYNSKNVMRLLGNQEIFDKSPLFSSDKVYRKISSFGLEGKEAYKTFTYTTDLLFPLSLLAFLICLHRYVGLQSEKTILKRVILPYAWFMMDLLENLNVFLLLLLFPDRYPVMAEALGIITTAKFVLLLSSMVIPLVVFVHHKFSNR